MVKYEPCKKGMEFLGQSGEDEGDGATRSDRMAGGDETLHVFLQHGPPELLRMLKRVAKLALCSTAS